MTTNIRIRVPKALIENSGNPANTIKDLLVSALGMKLKPVHTTSVLCVYASVYLGPSLSSDIEQEYTEDNLSRTCQGLLAAWFLAMKSNKMLEEKQERIGRSVMEYFDARPEQEQLFGYIQKVMSCSEAAGILEASTGTGKGRVLMAGALYAHEETENPVVVCAPTIQILSQLCQEYMSISATHRQVVEGKFCVLLGKDNFVSTAMIDLWMETEADEETRKVVEQWLKNGAGQVGTKTAALHALMPRTKYLLADAREIAPDVPWGELSLSNLDSPDELDEGYKVYSQLKDIQLKKSSLVLTTHSMVVMDAMLKKRNGEGLLPTYSTLIVDEAHTFAGVAENVFSKHGSIRSIVAELSNEDYWKRQRKLTLAQQSIAKVKSVGEELRNLAKTQKSERLNINQGEGREQFARCLFQLKSALAPLVSSAIAYGKVQEAYEICRDFEKGNFRIDLVKSPVREYPSLQSGAVSMSGFFSGFWESIKHLMLASATCYVPGVNGKMNAGLLLASLNLTKRFGVDGVKKFCPVVPPWLYPSVTVFESKDKSLIFPSIEHDNGTGFETQLNEWYQSVASYIRHIHANASGGTLVLLPSYDAIKALADLLIDIPVISQKVATFSRCNEEFVHANKCKRKVVWLGTGSAWTGLDCSDPSVSPENDNLLTDLVIPKIPFGVERSMAHQRRQKTMPTTERDRALFQFKQGIGRLIRRPGLQNRKLWILDGRIYNKDKAWLYKPFQNMVAQYKNRQLINLFKA